MEAYQKPRLGPETCHALSLQYENVRKAEEQKSTGDDGPEQENRHFDHHSRYGEREVFSEEGQHAPGMSPFTEHGDEDFDEEQHDYDRGRSAENKNRGGR